MSGIPDPGGVSGTFAALERTSPIVESKTGDAPTTTSMRVANGTQTEHRAVLQLIRNNLADFEEFGLVAFEMRPRPAGQHGGGDVQIAILTEEHATLLLTYMRNSEIVRDFKKRLVREFSTEKRWIYRQFIGRRFSKKAGKLVDEHEWRAYADKKHEFRLIPQHKAPRHHNNQLRQTLYVTPPGARAIRALVGTAVVSS